MEIEKHCVLCGTVYIARSNRARYCAGCRKKESQRTANEAKRKARMARRVKAEIEGYKKPVFSVDEVAAMARESGMTYGQYMARHKSL